MVLWFDGPADHDREIENNLGQALQDEIIARTEHRWFWEKTLEHPWSDLSSAAKKVSRADRMFEDQFLSAVRMTSLRNSRAQPSAPPRL
jgi:hypothetical protein